MPAEDEAHLLAAMARLMLASDREAVIEEGFSLLCQAAEGATRTGNMELVGDLADAFNGLDDDRQPHSRRTLAASELDRLTDVLDESEILREWRASKVDRACESLAPRFAGKVLHLVGGYEVVWADGLATSLGLAELRHHAAEKDKSPTADWTKGLDAERDVVVILWENIGHALSGNVKEDCRRKNIPICESKSGRLHLLGALEQNLSEFRITR